VDDKPTADRLDEQQLDEMLQKAVAGDSAADPFVRQILARPEVAELLGNLAGQVEATVIDNLCGKDLAYREGVRQKLARMRAELAGSDPTPLEAGLVERVVLNWLVLHDAELKLAQLGPQETRRAEFWERRVNGAHRRYVSSLKALAAVRKLALPVLIGQLNIAERQVNKTVAAPTAVPV
jgi:hypothetical protein